MPSSWPLPISFMLLVYRQSHKVAFEKSDIFFLCILRALTSNITVQETELMAAKVSEMGIPGNSLAFHNHKFSVLSSQMLSVLVNFIDCGLL